MYGPFPPPACSLPTLFVISPGRRLGLISMFKLDYMTPVSCFFSEFLTTAVLVIVLLAISDKKNCPPPAGLAPLALFILILGIGACLGMETSYAINPARDFGARLLTFAVGYGTQVYTYRKSVIFIPPRFAA